MLWQTITKRYGLLVADYYGFNQITDMIFTVFYKKIQLRLSLFCLYKLHVVFSFCQTTSSVTHRPSSPSILYPVPPLGLG
jgi:hypothetical protein